MGWYWLTLILCVGGVAVGYLGRVKGKRGWGTPLVLVCLIGILGTFGYRLFGPERDKSPYKVPPSPLSVTAERARVVGELLRGRLPKGANITVVWTWDISTNRGAKWQYWQDGLKEGLQDDTIEVVHFLGGTLNLAWNGPMQGKFMQIRGSDAAIYVGHFDPVETLGEPVVAAYYTRLTSGYVTDTRDQVQALVDAGKVDVAVWEDERRERVVITSEEKGAPVDAAPEGDGEPAEVAPEGDGEPAEVAPEEEAEPVPVPPEE
jgi:hypothetical protein